MEGLSRRRLIALSRNDALLGGHVTSEPLKHRKGLSILIGLAENNI
jgi:hypothetical protein